ncbi:hypothetical protein ADUPG1_012225, partial [Aduncisulcus paluster]
SSKPVKQSKVDSDTSESSISLSIERLTLSETTHFLCCSSLVEDLCENLCDVIVSASEWSVEEWKRQREEERRARSECRAIYRKELEEWRSHIYEDGYDSHALKLKPSVQSKLSFIHPSEPKTPCLPSCSLLSSLASLCEFISITSQLIPYQETIREMLSHCILCVCEMVRPMRKDHVRDLINLGVWWKDWRRVEKKGEEEEEEERKEEEEEEEKGEEEEEEEKMRKDKINGKETKERDGNNSLDPTSIEKKDNSDIEDKEKGKGEEKEDVRTQDSSSHICLPTNVSSDSGSVEGQKGQEMFPRNLISMKPPVNIGLFSEITEIESNWGQSEYDIKEMNEECDFMNSEEKMRECEYWFEWQDCMKDGYQIKLQQTLSFYNLLRTGDYKSYETPKQPNSIMAVSPHYNSSHLSFLRIIHPTLPSSFTSLLSLVPCLVSYATSCFPAVISLLSHIGSFFPTYALSILQSHFASYFLSEGKKRKRSLACAVGVILIIFNELNRRLDEEKDFFERKQKWIGRRELWKNNWCSFMQIEEASAYTNAKTTYQRAYLSKYHPELFPPGEYLLPWPNSLQIPPSNVSQTTLRPSFALSLSYLFSGICDGLMTFGMAHEIGNRLWSQTESCFVQVNASSTNANHSSVSNDIEAKEGDLDANDAAKKDLASEDDKSKTTVCIVKTSVATVDIEIISQSFHYEYPSKDELVAFREKMENCQHEIEKKAKEAALFYEAQDSINYNRVNDEQRQYNESYRELKKQYDRQLEEIGHLKSSPNIKLYENALGRLCYDTPMQEVNVFITLPSVEHPPWMITFSRYLIQSLRSMLRIIDTCACRLPNSYCQNRPHVEATRPSSSSVREKTLRSEISAISEAISIETSRGIRQEREGGFSHDEMSTSLGQQFPYLPFLPRMRPNAKIVEYLEIIDSLALWVMLLKKLFVANSLLISDINAFSQHLFRAPMPDTFQQEIDMVLDGLYVHCFYNALCKYKRDEEKYLGSSKHAPRDSTSNPSSGQLLAQQQQGLESELKSKGPIEQVLSSERKTTGNSTSLIVRKRIAFRDIWKNHFPAYFYSDTFSRILVCDRLIMKNIAECKRRVRDAEKLDQLDAAAKMIETHKFILSNVLRMFSSSPIPHISHTSKQMYDEFISTKYHLKQRFDDYDSIRKYGK